MYGSAYDDRPAQHEGGSSRAGKNIQEPIVQMVLGAETASQHLRLPFPPNRFISRPRVTASLRHALRGGVAVVRVFRGSGARTAVAELITQDEIPTKTAWCSADDLEQLDIARIGKQTGALLVVEDKYGVAADLIMELACQLRASSNTRICVLTQDSTAYQRPAIISKVDLEFVDERTLLLSDEEVESLAEKFGLRITPSALEHVARVTGGWAEGLKVVLSGFAQVDTWVDNENVESMLKPGLEWVRELVPVAVEGLPESRLWASVSVPNFVDDSLIKATNISPQAVEAELHRLMGIGMATRELQNGANRWRLNPLLRSALMASLDQQTLEKTAASMSEVLLNQNQLAEAIRLAAASNMIERILRATDRAFGRLDLEDWLQLATDVPPAALMRMPTLISVRGSIEDRLTQGDRLEWRTNQELEDPDPLELAGLAAELRAQGDLLGELKLLPLISEARSKADSIEVASTLQIQEVSTLISLGRFSLASHQAVVVDIQAGTPLFRTLYLAALRALGRAAIGDTAGAQVEAETARRVDAREFYIGSRADAELRLASALAHLWAGRAKPAGRVLEEIAIDLGRTPYQLLRHIAKGLFHYLCGDLSNARKQFLKGRALADITDGGEARGFADYMLARISLLTGEIQPVERTPKRPYETRSAWADLTAAQYALLRHDLESAQAMSKEAVNRSPTESVMSLTGQFLLAASLRRQGDHDAATEVAAPALASAQLGSNVFPLLAIPSPDLIGLLDLAGEEALPIARAALELKGLELAGELKDGALTSREREIVSELASGDTFDRIARRLFVSENTLRSHTRNVYKKLGVQSRHDAVNRSFQLGILHPSSSTDTIKSSARGGRTGEDNS